MYMYIMMQGVGDLMMNTLIYDMRKYHGHILSHLDLSTDERGYVKPFIAISGNQSEGGYAILMPLKDCGKLIMVQMLNNLWPIDYSLHGYTCNNQSFCHY